MLVRKQIEELRVLFSPPFIDEDVIAEVTSTLESGWITTGPKVKELEGLIAELVDTPNVACVNSWTSGAMLVLKWLGIGPGDEVIVPAYTYAATALCVVNVGATPVMVDVLDDFTIDPGGIAKAITDRTKAVIAVDIAGWPCNYSEISKVLNADEVRRNFSPANEIQKKFGRPALIADAAHSMGALYRNKSAALAPDIAIHSLHAVKNITTAEGGAICLSLPEPFDNDEVGGWMKLNSLNGQTKDAFAKLQSSAWKYDIVSDGLKINMPDICAAIGLAQIRKYHSYILPERKRVVDHYLSFFRLKNWAIIPPFEQDDRASSYHLFLLRIRGINEEQRDIIIKELADRNIAVNVHFVPMPMLTLFKGMGYSIDDFPNAYRNYACEISLPVYPQLTDEQCTLLEDTLEQVYNQVLNDTCF